MIINLFSIFDSNTNNLLEINWLSSIFNIFLIPIIFWTCNSRLIYLFKLIIILIYNELKIIFKNKFNYINSIFFISLFIFILINNFIGIFPYIFTRSSHIIFSITLSLPLWIRLILFLWIKNWNLAFAHIIP